jgi:hypothetical protein
MRQPGKVFKAVIARSSSLQRGVYRFARCCCERSGTERGNPAVAVIARSRRRRGNPGKTNSFFLICKAFVKQPFCQTALMLSGLLRRKLPLLRNDGNGRIASRLRYATAWQAAATELLAMTARLGQGDGGSVPDWCIFTAV